MTTDAASRIMADYLRRLQAACTAARLPASTAFVLQEQIAARLAEGRAAAAGDGTVAVLDAIERLGDPEAVAAAAAAAGGSSGAERELPPVSQQFADLGREQLASAESWVQRTTGGATLVEVVAIAGIGAGWVLPGPGWLIGAVALFMAPRWTTPEKLLALLVPLVLFAGFFIVGASIGLAWGSFVFDFPASGFPVLGLAVFVSPIVWLLAGWFLWARLRPRLVTS